MKTTFSFRSAAVKDAAGGTRRLESVEGDDAGSPRRQIRLRFVAKGKPVATIELSRREAYALSEWLDGFVTHER